MRFATYGRRALIVAIEALFADSYYRHAPAVLPVVPIAVLHSITIRASEPEADLNLRNVRAITANVFMARICTKL